MAYHDDKKRDHHGLLCKGYALRSWAVHWKEAPAAWCRTNPFAHSKGGKKLWKRFLFQNIHINCICLSFSSVSKDFKRFQKHVLAVALNHVWETNMNEAVPALETFQISNLKFFISMLSSGAGRGCPAQSSPLFKWRVDRKGTKGTQGIHLSPQQLTYLLTCVDQNNCWLPRYTFRSNCKDFGIENPRQK